MCSSDLGGVGLIELARSMSETIVLTEVLSGNVDLGESLKWSACWLNRINYWWLKIEINHDTSMESIFSVLDNHSGLTSFMERW